VRDPDRSGVDAFEAFRAYLEKEVAPLLSLEKREEVLDGIVRAAYTFGGALRRRGGGAGDFIAFTQHGGAEEPDEEEERELSPPHNVVGFPPPRESPEVPREGSGS